MDYRKATKELRAEMAQLRAEHRKGWLLLLSEALMRGSAERSMVALIVFCIKEREIQRTAHILRNGYAPFPKGSIVSINKGGEPIIPERLKNSNPNS